MRVGLRRDRTGTWAEGDTKFGDETAGGILRKEEAGGGGE